MSPSLKQLHRKMQRELHINRKSNKYKKLKSKFKKMKRKAVKTFYSDFVNELKCSDPAKWYAMAKKIGAVDQMNEGEVKVECLSNLNNVQSAQKIHNTLLPFPMNTLLLTLPSYLATCLPSPHPR